jgi:hypothetical protein
MRSSLRLARSSSPQMHQAARSSCLKLSALAAAAVLVASIQLWEARQEVEMVALAGLTACSPI